jgi:hypothetical protein
MENKNAAIEISYKPIAYVFVFGALGFGVGRNIGKLMSFNSPGMAGFSVFILSLLSAYVLYSIGVKIVKSINSLDVPKDKKITYAWITVVVGTFVILLTGGIIGTAAK